VPAPAWRDVIHLLPVAVGIFLVSFADEILTARSFAGKHSQHVRASQELLATRFSGARTRMTRSSARANARYFKGRVREAIRAAPTQVSCLVFDPEAATHVDSTGLEALDHLAKDLRARRSRSWLPGSGHEWRGNSSVPASPRRSAATASTLGTRRRGRRAPEHKRPQPERVAPDGLDVASPITRSARSSRSYV
jgi:MFS superfamily sulfate permease-like transporter